MSKKYELIKVFTTCDMPEDLSEELCNLFDEDEDFLIGYKVGDDMIRWEESKGITEQLSTWLLENGAEKDENILIELMW